MRPLPCVPGVAAAAALLLLLLPRARADEHEHTVRGVAGRRCRPGPAPPYPRSPLGQAQRGLESPVSGLSPTAVQRRLPVRPGGAGTPGAGRRHFRALPDRRTPRPECLGLLPLPGAK